MEGNVSGMVGAYKIEK